MKRLLMLPWSVCMLLTLCCGCSEQSSEPVTPSAPGEITFQLYSTGKVDVATRAGENLTLGGVSVTNLWVVQYDLNGVHKATKNISLSGAESKNNGAIIEVKTAGFDNVASRFYVMVNATKLAENFNGAESVLQGQVEDIVAGTTAIPTLLTSGPLTYTPSEGKVVLVAPLTRAYSQVTLRWRTSANFQGTAAVTNVTVGNLPKQMAYFTRGGLSSPATYPLVSNIQATGTSITNGALGLGSATSFYMGENLRGTGTSTSFSEKNLASKGPGGALDGCTYLVFSVNYTYPEATSPITLEYRVYLGGNLMNDYNIQRGYSYDLTLIISGANSADLRVTITNGNVVVFDKVDEISKTVDF